MVSWGRSLREERRPAREEKDPHDHNPSPLHRRSRRLRSLKNTVMECDACSERSRGDGDGVAGERERWAGRNRSESRGQTGSKEKKTEVDRDGEIG